VNFDSDDLIKGINAPERETSLYLYRDKPRVSRCALMSRRHAKGLAASIGAVTNPSERDLNAQLSAAVTWIPRGRRWKSIKKNTKLRGWMKSR